MAETPLPKLEFEGRCPDCGQRQAELPAVLPEVGDDFNWRARDYDSIRIFMLEELAARFPERNRWTPADLEVVLVEVLATVLDQLSDMADRVAAESYLETARRPETVRRLLNFIGYDAVRRIRLKDDPETQPGHLTAEQKLEQLWVDNPLLMEQARRAGPRSVHNQQRMVSARDYTLRLEEHPIVMRAAAQSHWSGSWITLYATVIFPWPDTRLDDEITFGQDLEEAVNGFHEQRGIPVPNWTGMQKPTYRMVLQPFLEAYRMSGYEVILQDAVPIGILIDISISIADSYFQSELRREIENVLSTRPGGFFEPGRLRFGEDLHASDFFQALMSLDGVENVCLNRFKRLGAQYLDQSAQGVIRLDGLEIAVCDNNPLQPDRGFYRLQFKGGRRG